MKKQLKIKLKSFTPTKSDQLILDNEFESYDKKFKAILKKHMAILKIPYKKTVVTSDCKEKIESFFSSFYFEK